jgi:hypothetical protein
LVTKKKPVKKTVRKKSNLKKKPVKKSVVKKKVVTKKPVTKKNVKNNGATKASVKAVAKKALAKDKKQDVEINKLRAEIDKLKKKKKNTKHVSEYNLFIRKQIKSGLTFTQAAKEWGKYQKLKYAPKRKQTAYNQFIGSQMRLGKTFKQAVALWKLAKAGKLGKKGSTRTITKTVVRRIKSKPKVITKTRTIQSKPKVIVRRIKSKPQIITRTRTIKSKPKVIIRKVMVKPKTSAQTSTVTKSVGLTKTQVEEIFDTSDEEIAFNVVETYFKELARVGFKKQLTLDEVINAYLYSLARVKRDDIEMSEVAKAVKEARLRK